MQRAPIGAADRDVDHLNTNGGSVQLVTFALVLGALTVAGFQSIPTPTEAMTVRHMKVNGGDLAYVEAGSSVTVLFVHGAEGDWRTWDVIHRYVCPRYRFVSVNRRCHFPNAWADDERYMSTAVG